MALDIDEARDLVVHKLVAQAGGLAGTGDLARRLGVTRQRVQQLSCDPRFPKPIGVAGGRPVWLIAEVEGWQDDRAAHRRIEPVSYAALGRISWLASQGWGAKRIARQMTLEGIEAPAGRSWSPSTVARTLR